VTQQSMVIGCQQLTDVTGMACRVRHYTIHGLREKFGGVVLVRHVHPTGKTMNWF